MNRIIKIGMDVHSTNYILCALLHTRWTGSGEMDPSFCIRKLRGWDPQYRRLGVEESLCRRVHQLARTRGILQMRGEIREENLACQMLGPEARVPESGEKRRVGDFIIKEFVNKFLQNSCKIKNSDKKSEKLFDILAKIDKECSTIENIK